VSAQTCRQTDRRTDIRTDRQTYIHTDRQTGRQTDRQSQMHRPVEAGPDGWNICIGRPTGRQADR